MTTVRLRLLILALLPLIVLMPFLLWLGGTRWTADYDRVLIANVQSDLRIAEQYLLRIMEGTGSELTSMAASTGFASALNNGPGARDEFLAAQRAALNLDFLYFLPQAPPSGTAWPVIRSALTGQNATEIDIFSAEDMAILPDGAGQEMAQQALFDLIETPAAVPTTREVEDRGMVVHSASPVRVAGHDGVVVGGILLNRNLQFIDTINALVYLNAVTGGDRQGTATLFLDDVRVSTNVRLFEGGRALGTRVSAAVRKAVLDDGQTWLARAFVVNDWYISGYLPLTDSFGNRVGMLYVGFLEAPFTAAKRAAVGWMIGAFLAVLLISAPLFLWLARGVFAPLERMSHTMNRVEAGNLSARNRVISRDELGQVAAHLDKLLDQVQDRDRELNARVEERTAELRAANEKLESTYRQLVMSEKLASIGEITAGVAHEINNPVAVIQGNVDVIRDTLGAQAKPLETELRLIDRQVMRIGAIVGKLLQFARPNEYSGSDETTSLQLVVEDCLVLVDHLLSKKAIQVTKDLHETPPVQIDPGEMQQVVINLIVNAVQAMGNAGTLSLGLRQMPRDGRDGICLDVGDTGPGIPQDKIDSVFAPFFTTKLGEGTGLGLSISQTLIQQAGGLISAQNQPSGGALFQIWLPAAQTDSLATG